MYAESKIVLCIIVIDVVCFLNYLMCKAYVKQLSERYQDISYLNDKFGLWVAFRKKYFCTVSHFRTRQQFRNFNYAKAFKGYVRDNLDVFAHLVDVYENNEIRDNYRLCISYAAGFEGFHFPYLFLGIAERLMCDRILFDFDKSGFSVTINAYYTSPGGRSHAQGHRSFGYDELKSVVHEMTVPSRKSGGIDVKKERSKLTKGLRYDVMKRDGFKCVICGRSASEGVVLHVDHIKPVSKGGRTEISNLRTLCMDCNLGKSAKYDVDSIN